jgi:uncharacterized protein DUF262/uncharacterized protein DUF1524
MAKKIEDHRYTVEEAFRECFYLVPDYQREYVWTEKEVQQLLDDIDEQIDGSEDREYFVGMVLVSLPDPKEGTRFEVIDGQQRLTTFFLLLCVLRHLFRGQPQDQALNALISTSYTDRDGDTHTSLKLEPRYENANEVVSTIVRAHGDPKAVREAIRTANLPSYGSLERLVTAYETTHHHLTTNYAATDNLKKYWGYVANNVVFIQISTDLGNALKIFETINERGIGLDPMDLLKNLLFRHVRHDQFSQLRDEWKKITRPLEKAHEKALRFLRYFLMANYEIRVEHGTGANKKVEAVVREDEIYQWFVDKQNASICDYANRPFEFVRKIVRNVEEYLGFRNGCGNDGQPNTPMDNLKRLCGEAFSLHHVLLLAACNFPRPLFDYFVGQLESFLFYYIFTKTPTKDLERSFSLWADELRAVGKVASAAAQQRGLNEFISDRFQRGMTAKERELTDALRRYSLDSMQQYRTRYLLAKITQFVDMKYNGLKTPGSLENYTKLEIEHILPNNPEPSLTAAWAAENPDKPYGDYKIKLGNLTLLESSLNKIASNDFFSRKKREYPKSANYLTRSIAQLTIAGQNTSINWISAKLQPLHDFQQEFCGANSLWMAGSIERRQEMLIELAREIWAITPLPVEGSATAD